MLGLRATCDELERGGNLFNDIRLFFHRNLQFVIKGS